MFEIKEGQCQMVHLNTRLEKHGDVEVVACDLNFVWETHNGMLAMFAPDLRGALYKRADDRQAELDPDPDHLVALRFSAIDTIKWGQGDVIGGALTFHTGVSAKSHVTVEDVKVTKFRLTCKEGGTVVIGFKVQCRPSSAEMGKFTGFLQAKDCLISVTPPGQDPD